MASVFLSYDHEDAARAAPIAAALEAHGHSVWWDRHIHGGAEYNSEIESAVERSDAVVVLWSTKSVRSAWVRDEAAEGRDGGKLVPVLIERVKPPMGFRQYQTIDLASWSGGKRIPQLGELLVAIGKATKTTPVDTGPAEQVAAKTPFPPTRVSGQGFSRRLLVGAGAATAAALAGGGIWWSRRPDVDPRFQALIEQGEQALRHSVDHNTVRIFEQAVAMRPDNPRALGLLALTKSLMAQGAGPADAAARVEDAERTIRRALSIDAKEPNALLAMFELQGSTVDWITRDQRLRQIIAIDPRNVGAIAELVLLTQATGMSRESWKWNERALALEPLSPDFLSKRALKLWIFGRPSEADKVIDQVRALYPTDPWVWFVRMQIYALTGRARAAQALIGNEPTTAGPSPMARLFSASLPALDQPSPRTIRNARDACVKAAEASPRLAGQAVLLMAALRQVDTAFQIADGLLLAKGEIVQRQQTGSASIVPDAAWRISTQWMFTPATGIMRADPRFLPLCEGVGLTDYWRKRRVKPDYQRT